MAITGDFFVGVHMPTENVRRAMARALGVRPAAVGIYAMGSGDGSTADVQIITVNDDLPGDYPGQYVVAADAVVADRFDDVLRRLSTALGTPILSDAGEDDPDIMNLFLPDGSVHACDMERDENDDSFHNTPEMQAAIDASHGRRAA